MKRAAALPLSFAAHAVALGTVVTLSVLPADLPAARAASRLPLEFTVARVPVVALREPAPAAARRPPAGRVPARETMRVPDRPAAPPVAVLAEGRPAVGPVVVGPLVDEDAVPCLGCEVGLAPSGRGSQDDEGRGMVAIAPVRVGGSIREPRKLRHVVPVYPEIARVARVGGAVTIECTVTPEGHVIDARVVSGHPLLSLAARQAVEQWQFSPTLLNGVPVPVILTVTVNFQLR